MKSKYGCTPSQFTTYQALVGDRCDNINGVPRVGPKTAVKILKNTEHIVWTKYRELIEHNMELVTLDPCIENLDENELVMFSTTDSIETIEYYSFNSLRKFCC